MDPTAAPPLSATTTTTHFHSIESNTDSWGEDTSVYQSNYGSTASAAAAAAASVGSIKLRLMCSAGGHIVPRPHDKSLCYVGGETHMVVVDRPTTLLDLTHRLSKTILRSSSTATSAFTLKYQLPSEDLDSLISVTTDEDLENMIEEYERLNSSSSSAVSKSSRLRLFIFPAKPESVTSIGSFLENSIKSEDWFLNALNGTTSGFSDTSSVNNLLGLDDEISLHEKKEVNQIQKVLLTTNLRGNNNSVQDVHSIPDSPMMETTSSFGSASSSPSQANLPPISDDHPKVGGGIEEQFSQMSVQQRHQKDQDGGFVAAPAPVAVSGSPMSSATAIAEQSDPFLSYHERSEQGLQMAYLKQQQQQQFQQKQSTSSILSDMTYQEPVVQIQSSSNHNRVADPNDTPDQNPRIQMQMQQQQNQNSAYLMSMPTTQPDAQHPQLHHQQQLQFINTTVPQPQYIHHHHPPPPPQVASYYQMYQPPAMDQQNFVYYMPTRQQPGQPPQGYNFPLQQQQADSSPPAPNNQTPPPATPNRTAQSAPQTELPMGVYRTTNSGGPQLIQVASGHQHQPQYVGFHHPSQSAVPSGGGGGGGGGNFGYEFSDSLQQGQRMYYATPPQSAAQYQTTPQSAAQYQPNSPSSQQSSNNR